MFKQKLRLVIVNRYETFPAKTKNTYETQTSAEADASTTKPGKKL